MSASLAFRVYSDHSRNLHDVEATREAWECILPALPQSTARRVDQTIAMLRARDHQDVIVSLSTSDAQSALEAFRRVNA